MDEFDKLLLEELRKLREKTEEQSDTLSSIDGTLRVQAEQLKEHMRRTEINEQSLNMLANEINTRISPIEKHVNGISFVLKTIGIVSVLSGLALTMLKIISYFS